MFENTFYGSPNFTLQEVAATLFEQNLTALVPADGEGFVSLYCKLDLGANSATWRTSDVPEWGPREVSRWNLVFWLLCFATNAYNQPTGRVLGLFYRHHALLRALPVLYAADGLAVLFRWLGQIAVARRGLREAASRIAAGRFVTADDGLPDADAVADARKHAWVRLTTFSFAVLPQFVKLCGSWRGLGVLPLALGHMFVGPWVFFELLLAAADVDQVRDLVARAKKTRHDRQRRWADAERYKTKAPFPKSWLTSHLLPGFFPQAEDLHLDAVWAFAAVVVSAALGTYLCIKSAKPTAALVDPDGKLRGMPYPVFMMCGLYSEIAFFFVLSLDRTLVYIYPWLSKYPRSSQPQGYLTIMILMFWAGGSDTYTYPFKLLIAALLSYLSVFLGPWFIHRGVDLPFIVYLSRQLASFIIIYEAEGTYQPGWLEYLG